MFAEVALDLLFAIFTHKNEGTTLLLADIFSLGGNSIEKIWLEFRLENPLEFRLEIPYTKKKLKN